MRPASAGYATGQLRSRLQVKVGNRGLCRRTEPRDADTQMQGFLDRGTVPVLLFKASPQQVQASLVRPLQAVRTELMSIATAILDRVAGGQQGLKVAIHSLMSGRLLCSPTRTIVVAASWEPTSYTQASNHTRTPKPGGWGCVEKLVEETRGDSIDRQQAEEFIEEYLKQHNVPGKLQIRWVNKLNSGGKLQEYGRRNKPTARRLRLWISSGFAGVKFSRSMTAFANHEICTHALRAINDHAQVLLTAVNSRTRVCGNRAY